MKKFFLLVCLAMFVTSLSACGGKSTDGVRAGVKKPDAPPLAEREDQAKTEVY